MAALGALHVDIADSIAHKDAAVPSSMKETLNGFLDAEADEIGRAQRYERSVGVAEERNEDVQG